jgi:hypothetical protein
MSSSFHTLKATSASASGGNNADYALNSDKLDGIDSTGFLQTSDRSTAAPPANSGAAPAQGTSTRLAREDHNHGAPTASTTASFFSRR